MAGQEPNTLYVITPGAFLARDHENLVVRVDGEEKLRVPVHHIGSVVCFGATSVSVSALGELAERGIGVSFLSEGGRFLARVEGRWQGGSLLRRDQYAAVTNCDRRVAAARGFVLGKLVNSRRLLLRSARDAALSDGTALRTAADRLERVVAAAARETELACLRGYEGEGASVYFEVFDLMLRHRGEGFALATRQRRPPRDPLNSLLSFLYVLLLHEMSSALLACGLDPAVGFLHVDRPGRPGLALDLMEELRPAFADRVALALINRRQISAQSFRAESSGAVRMDDATRRSVLVEWRERQRDTVTHPLIGEQVTLAQVPHVQARLLARFIRGDLDEYPPYVID
jgi:CRISPR-associated protein Cas1